MAEFKRNVKCVNCGSERTVYVSSDMAITELLFHGKCPQCNSSIQLNFSLVGEPAPGTSSGTSASSSSEPATVNLDETLFEPELPNNALKDLIED